MRRPEQYKPTVIPTDEDVKDMSIATLDKLLFGLSRDVVAASIAVALRDRKDWTDVELAAMHKVIADEMWSRVT